jgi:hypothetical protein
MRNAMLTAMILLLSALVHTAPLAGQVIKYAGPKCLGPACINRKSSIRSLFAQVGEPRTKGVPYCYRAKDGRASLAIAVVRGELADIDLSSSAQCDARFPSGSTQTDLYGWKTPEGIRLGSPVEDVFKAYGKPYRNVAGTYTPKTMEEPPSQVRDGEFFYWGTLEALPVSGPPFSWRGIFAIRAGRVSRIELQENVYSGPLRLGPFAVDRNVSLHSLFKVLGPPARFWCYCYRSQTGDAFLAIEEIHTEPGIAGDVLLSDFPVCVHMPVKVTATELRDWRTPEGIGLGSLEEEVVRVYGKPTFPNAGRARFPDYLGCYQHGEEAPYIDGELGYGGPELTFARFGICKAKVSYILLSDNE